MNFDDLTEKQQLFVDKYLDLGDRDKAYHKAGYSIEGRGWKANSRKMYQKLQHVIEERIDMRIGEGAIMALKIVKEIMQDKNVAPATRLKAAQDYMTRAGRDRTKETKLIVSKEAELTDEQLDQEIRTLSGELSDGKSLH